LAPVTEFLDALRSSGEPATLSSLAASRLDALELEVRRTVRERRKQKEPRQKRETA
jgi:hypothetical protein